MKGLLHYFFSNLLLVLAILGIGILPMVGGCATIPMPYSNSPINFTYEMQGAPYQLRQLQGKPMLLVLVRTSEVTNEMHLDELQKVHKKLHNRITILVLTIAPNEKPMLDMFVEFHDYPFHIGIAQEGVALGQSPLGIIPNVPTTYILSANGMVLEMLPGAMNTEKMLSALQTHHIIP